jgi:branched-chain amino acid transport system permease protein
VVPGHAFFLAIGAYTAAVISGSHEGARWVSRPEILVWLPAAGTSRRSRG